MLLNRLGSRGSCVYVIQRLLHSVSSSCGINVIFSILGCFPTFHFQIFQNKLNFFSTMSNMKKIKQTQNKRKGMLPNRFLFTRNNCTGYSAKRGNWLPLSHKSSFIIASIVPFFVI